MVTEMVLKRAMHWVARGNCFVLCFVFLMGYYVVYHRYIYPNVVAHMPTEVRATHYKMNHQNRGVALIFNHENFLIDGLKSRTGTRKDCEDLDKHLKKLGFDVHVFHDIDYNELCHHVETCEYF